MKLLPIVCLLGLPMFSSCIISLKDEHPKPKPIKVDVNYEIIRAPLTEKLNTFDEKYQWERREQGTTTLGAETSTTLTKEEQVLVLNKALVNRFFQMPDTIAWIAQAASAAATTSAPVGSSLPLIINKPKAASPTPPPVQYLHIKAEQLDKTVLWRGDLSTLAQQNTNALKIQAIYSYIDSILSVKEEVVQMRAKAPH